MSKFKLKNLKVIHWIYNLLHYRQLKHNTTAYKKYGVKKPLFASLSSKDFPNKESQAWLDLAPSADVAPEHPEFSTFDPSIQKKITEWSDHANLVHGGLPITNPTSTRKSMVIHYYASDVIKYREITERPSLLKPE